MFDDPLIKKWFLKTAKPDERLHSESLTRPVDADATAAAAAAEPAAPLTLAPGAGADALSLRRALHASTGSKSGVSTSTEPQDAELDEAIMAVWESAEVLDVGVFEHLAAQVCG